MTRDEIRRVIHDSLCSVAPEADPASLSADANVREELDLDSMDFLNYLTALHNTLKVDIPENDYQRLFTLGGAESYLAEKLAG